MTTLFVEIFRICKRNGSSAWLFLHVLSILASVSVASSSATSKRIKDDSYYSDYYDDVAATAPGTATVNAEVSAPSYEDESVENVHQHDDYESNDKFSNSMVDSDEQSARQFVSEHEIPRQVPVKVKIRGDLATPAPDADIKLAFVPKQTYYQVRRYDTQLHLPRSAAFAEAQTDEELINAPRLREVVSHKKTQEVSYTYQVVHLHTSRT